MSKVLTFRFFQRNVYHHKHPDWKCNGSACFRLKAGRALNGNPKTIFTMGRSITWVVSTFQGVFGTGSIPLFQVLRWLAS